MKRRRLCCLGIGRLGLVFMAFLWEFKEQGFAYIWMDGWDGMGLHDGNWKPGNTA